MASRTQTSKPATADTAMVGANLARDYAEKMRFLHAATGRSRKSLIQEALDTLFATHADKLASFGKSPKRKKSD